MVDKLPIEMFDTSSAAESTAPVYATGHVTWAVVSGASTTYNYSNTTASGLRTLVAGGDTAEYVIVGMNATKIPANTPVTVNIDLWEAMSQSGVAKGCIARLRDGDITGPILASHTFTDAGDSTAGHQQEWFYNATHTPANGALCVTIQSTSGTPTITSDTRTFDVTQ